MLNDHRLFTEVHEALMQAQQEQHAVVSRKSSGAKQSTTTTTTTTAAVIALSEDVLAQLVGRSHEVS